MTTRRTLLAALAGAPLAGALAACDRAPTTVADPGPDPKGARLLVETSAGPAVIDTAGRPVVPAAAGVFSPDRSRLVTTRDGRLTVYNTRTGRPTAAGDAAALSPRIVSPDGLLVGLATPENPRERTTIEVRPAHGNPKTVTVAGNLEPEAFSADGGSVFVLDYLPPAAPDRYRVRQLEVATGQLHPLNTRLKTAVPPGAEEEMRGEGRQAVYDPTRRRLFTLYTHQPDHVHTRDLLKGGARPDAPHVHAFVHTLSLAEGWAYCVDLPTPFGEHAAAAHAIALGPDSASVAVVDTTTGTAALIDPESLTITGTARFTPPETSGAGAASVAFGRPWQLTVAAGKAVRVLNPGRPSETATWTAPGPVCGLAIVDGTAYVGGAGSITKHDLTTGRQTGSIPVPTLTRLLHALPAV